jgi:hypothetical protein
MVMELTEDERAIAAGKRGEAATMAADSRLKLIELEAIRR